jgi:hypothetical protein
MRPVVLRSSRVVLVFRSKSVVVGKYLRLTQALASVAHDILRLRYEVQDVVATRDVHLDRPKKDKGVDVACAASGSDLESPKHALLRQKLTNSSRTSTTTELSLRHF